jgi:hypothetical protein
MENPQCAWCRVRRRRRHAHGLRPAATHLPVRRHRRPQSVVAPPVSDRPPPTFLSDGTIAPTGPPLPLISRRLLFHHAAHRFPAGALRLSPPHACAASLILCSNEKRRPMPLPYSHHHHALPSPCVRLSS